MRRSFRTIVTGLTLTLAAGVVSAAALELIVRWVAPQDLYRSEGLLAPDPVRSFRLTPGFRGASVAPEFNVPIHINSRGLRDREIAPTKARGVYRVLVLGDSFTYGRGVAGEETYPRRLEVLLNRGSGRRRYEVINAGVGGYGTFHEAALLRDEGWAYQPDFLVLQVTPGNDLMENLYPFKLAERSAGPAWLERAKGFSRHHSHAYRFIGDRYHLLRIRLGWDPFYAGSLGVYARSPSAEIERGWAATRAYLGDIARMARARGVGLLVLHAPKNVELDRDLQAAFVGFHRADMAELDWDRPGWTLAEICVAEGVPYLDPAPRFRQTGHPLNLYYPYDGHWNPRGHLQVALWIFERLEADGVLREKVARDQPPRAAR